MAGRQRATREEGKVEQLGSSRAGVTCDGLCEVAADTKLISDLLAATSRRGCAFAVRKRSRSQE